MLLPLPLPLPSGRSSTTPLSLASRRRLCSRAAAAAAMPLRWAMGILCCGARLAGEAPRAARRSEVAAWRARPEAKGLEAEGEEEEECGEEAERRWDSEMRRCRARSFARRAAESSGSSEALAGLLLRRDEGGLVSSEAKVEDGGLED